MNNITNPYSSGEKNILRKVDFYRKVPKDLTEASSLGATMSVCAFLAMGVLFLSETIAFSRSTIVTSVSLDESLEPRVRLNFNITFFELKCDFLSVDVWDKIGTTRQNVTKNVEKWQLDKAGVRRIFGGRNREVRDVRHDEWGVTLEDMHADEHGQHVLELDRSNFRQFLEQHEMAFINFFAPWCIWCQRMHPTWEMFAREVRKNRMPVGVANVNCEKEPGVCQQARVMAFPTVRWFHSGNPVEPDYRQDRTVNAMMAFARRKLEQDEKFKSWDKGRGGNDDDAPGRANPAASGRPEHPGCQVSGHLMVNRVPGNFLVEAKSKQHSLNAAMADLSHRVNHLSFGEPLDRSKYKTRRILKQVPNDHKQFSPVDGKEYKTDRLHRAWHHYLKVVSTNMELGGERNSMSTYQILEQSQIVHYSETDVPQARFSYDISPMSVVVKKDERRWYDYLTSLCAIIGGSFTTLGLIDGFLYKVIKPKSE